MNSQLSAAKADTKKVAKESAEASISLNGGLTWSKMAVFAMLMIASAFTGSFTQQTVNPPRPDPFTSKNGEQLEKRLREHVAHQFELHRATEALEIKKALDGIRSRMPPPSTRARIRELERWAASKNDGFEAASDQWE